MTYSEGERGFRQEDQSAEWAALWALLLVQKVVGEHTRNSTGHTGRVGETVSLAWPGAQGLWGQMCCWKRVGLENCSDGRRPMRSPCYAGGRGSHCPVCGLAFSWPITPGSLGRVVVFAAQTLLQQGVPSASELTSFLCPCGHCEGTKRQGGVMLFFSSKYSVVFKGSQVWWQGELTVLKGNYVEKVHK